MSQVDLAYEMLRADLEAPRLLLPQVIRYIDTHYNYGPEQFEQFVLEKFPSLEEYELDLTFSPQYTPAEHNRLEYMPLLGGNAFTPAEVALLKRRLVDEKLLARFNTPENEQFVDVPLHEVFIDRYVDLLKLDQAIPEALYQGLMNWVPESSRNEINLVARDDAWRSEGRQTILLAFLKVFQAKNTFSTVKASYLTNFVRTYRPASLLAVDRQLDSLIKSCQDDMERVSGRGFQDEYLRSLHGRAPQNTQDEKAVWAHFQHMMDMAKQLKDDFNAMPEVAPELLQKAQQEQPV